MLIDKLENSYLYEGISAKIKKGLEVLKDESLSGKKDGRYEVDGENIYYIIQRYATQPVKAGRLEAHRKYIDIQFAASGEEVIGHSFLGCLDIEEPYDQAKDVIFYKVPEKINTIMLREGTFCILFPQDGHMPGCQAAGPGDITKIVVKVKIDD
jgi:YhcH/YjgK/YiaL family protein